MAFPLRCLLPILGALSVFGSAAAAPSNETTPEVDMIPIPQTYMVEFAEGFVSEFASHSFDTELISGGCCLLLHLPGDSTNSRSSQTQPDLHSLQRLFLCA